MEISSANCYYHYYQYSGIALTILFFLLLLFPYEGEGWFFNFFEQLNWDFDEYFIEYISILLII